MNTHLIRLTVSHGSALSLLFFLFLNPALGGVIPGRWEKVDRLPPGTAIVLETRSQNAVAGTFEASDDSSLTLQVGDRSLQLPKSEVLKVSEAEVTRRSGRKGALTGAVIGGASLGLFGALGTTGDSCGGIAPCFTRGRTGAIGAAVGGGFGALIGFAVAKARTSREVLYRAP